MTFITDEQLKAMEREREDSRALGTDLGKLEPMMPALRRRLFALNNPEGTFKVFCPKGKCKSRFLQKQ